MCSNKLLKKLGIANAEIYPCTLQTVNVCKMTQDVRLTSLSVKGLNLTKSIDITNVLAVSNLPDLQDSISSDTDVHRYTHLSGIQFTKLDSTDIDLLIGADIQPAH